MGTLKAEVVKVDVSKHPDADRLDLIKVKGWQCVSQRGLYKTGDLAVYLPVDSVLPPELVKALEIEKYYSKRLRTVRLRGYLSQGMVASFDTLAKAGYPVPGAVEGYDLTDLLGITKYEEPIPVEMAGVRIPDDGRFVAYTGIENIKNFPDILVPGEEVVVMEKVHGTNFRAARFGEEILFGSHAVNLALPRDYTRWEKFKRAIGLSVPKVNTESNLYWRGYKMLEGAIVNEQVFGEIYGSGVQDLAYGKKPGEVDVVVFDVFREGKYLDYAQLEAWCATRARNMAPLLYRGPWDPIETPKFAAGNSVLAKDQIREGVVVRPVNERWDPRVGRVILKIINDDYLLRKDATERH